MAQHTQGEWEYTPQPVASYGYYILTVDKSHKKTFIGEVGGGLHTPQEIEANAKLVSAAPEMLAALIQVKEWLELQEDKKNGTHIRLIDSVIKKVTN